MVQRLVHLGQPLLLSALPVASPQMRRAIGGMHAGACEPRGLGRSGSLAGEFGFRQVESRSRFLLQTLVALNEIESRFKLFDGGPEFGHAFLGKIRRIVAAFFEVLDEPFHCLDVSFHFV